MNFVRKILLFIVIILLLIILLLIFVYLQIKNINPCDTKYINNEVFVLRVNNFNVYGIKISNDIILIDSGDSYINLANELKKIRINPDMIKMVFLTHSDYDHVGGISGLSNTKIFFPENEVQYINKSRKRILYYGLKRIYNKLSITNYQIIKNNELIKYNFIEVKGIATPGHTYGSMSYLVNNKYLFTGDLLLIKGNKIITMPTIFSENMNLLKQSIKMISKFKNIEILGTTHSGFTTNWNNLK